MTYHIRAWFWLSLRDIADRLSMFANAKGKAVFDEALAGEKPWTQEP